MARVLRSSSTAFTSSHKNVILVTAILAMLSLSTTGYAGCRYLKQASLDVTVANSTPTIGGSVNSHGINLLVDTGAVQTLLSKKFAERFDLALSHTDRTSFGVGGVSQKYSAVVNEFSVGNIKGGKTRLAIVAESNVPNIDAILGVDFLFQRDLEIAFADKKLNYFYPSNCENAFLAYWDPNASVVTTRDVSSRDKRQVFNVEIEGQNFLALVDTGAQISVIDKAAAARLGLSEQSVGVTKKSSIMGGGKRVVDNWLLPLKDLRFGAEVVSDIKITMSDLYGGLSSDSQTIETTYFIKDQPEIILGMDFIQSHRLLFAISQRKMYFSYLGGPVFQGGKVDRVVDVAPD